MNKPAYNRGFLLYRQAVIMNSLYRLAVIVVSLTTASMSVNATNGYFRVGHSPNSIAMAGATSAKAQDTMASTYNPALTAEIEDGVTVALSFFSPDRGFEVTGASPMLANPGEFALSLGEVRSDSELFLIPAFAYKQSLNDDWALSVSVYGNGGMNTDYSESVFYAGKTGVDLMQLFVNTTFSFTINENSHIGFAPILAYQVFEANGVGSFAPYSQDASKLSNNHHDSATGYGFRIGYQQDLSHWASVGISYQSKINFDAFDDYSGLFAGDGDFDVPETYNIGFSFTHDDVELAIDYQRINYSDVASVGNSMLPNIQTDQLGAKNGAGFGWQDMEIYKLGLAIGVNDDDTLRFGLSYGDQPIPEDEVLFNILAPGVQEVHVTAGYEFNAGDSEYAVALMYSPSSSVKGRNPLYQSQKQYIELEMSQVELTLSVTF